MLPKMMTLSRHSCMDSSYESDKRSPRKDAGISFYWLLFSDQTSSVESLRWVSLEIGKYGYWEETISKMYRNISME